jgi:hypothetical protein
MGKLTATPFVHLSLFEKACFSHVNDNRGLAKADCRIVTRTEKAKINFFIGIPFLFVNLPLDLASCEQKSTTFRFIVNYTGEPKLRLVKEVA